jgi:hypothetical protein
VAKSRRFVLLSLVVTAALLLGGLAAPAAAAPIDQKPTQLRWYPAGLLERVLSFVLGGPSEENPPAPTPAAEPSPTQEGSTPQVTDTSTTQISPAMDPDG